jgi:hypothetical protein
MTNDDKIAKLEAEIEKLKARDKPPEPFQSDWKPYDPTERMSMPKSAMMEMANAVPDHVMRGVVRDNRAPQGPSAAGVIGQITIVRPGGGGAGDGTGWAREIPFGPSPHQRYVDAQLDAQDARDRAERIEQDRRLKAMEGK